MEGSCGKHNNDCMEREIENCELDWAEVTEAGRLVKRVGRSKSTGAILIECKLDQQGREIEKIFFGDAGEVSKRIVCETDQERKPRLTLVYDGQGKLIWRQERGKRPESLA